jgi:hypothetical protein
MTDFQARYNDHRRQMARVNEEGWKFDPPMARRGVRVTIARALVSLAARLSPSVQVTNSDGDAASIGSALTPNAASS